MFGITTELIRSSEVGSRETKLNLKLELCREVGANTYISGPFGREYLDGTAFKEQNIEIRFHEYVHPTYRQVFDGFEPYMSAIAMLFNEGSGSRQVLESPMDSLTE